MSVEKYYETYWSPEGFQPEVEMGSWLRQLLEDNVPERARCVDVGCGDGNTYAAWLASRGVDYVGVDISERAVEIARSRGLDACKIADASVLPFTDNAFDVAVCVELLEHLFEPQRAVSEMQRVLKPGGILIATVPNLAYWRRRVDLAIFGRWNPLGDDRSVEQPWRDPHIRFFNPGSLHRMLASSGFSDIQVGGHSGTLLGDLPRVNRLVGRNNASGLYRAAERKVPSMFGYGLYVLARKPRD